MLTKAAAAPAVPLPPLQKGTQLDMADGLLGMPSDRETEEKESWKTEAALD